MAFGAAGAESEEETGTANDPILLIADGQLSTRVDWPELLKPSTFVSSSWTIHSCNNNNNNNNNQMNWKTIRKSFKKVLNLF